MDTFKRYRKRQIAEMREVTNDDVMEYLFTGVLTHQVDGKYIQISISAVDAINGSPRLGDMIARNPENHSDQWLVAKKYFDDNFELIDPK